MGIPRTKAKSLTLGMRSIKTLASTAILALIYSAIGRNPCFACIGAVFGMGNMFRQGLRTGGNRLVGTVLGGLVAVPLYPMYHGQWLGIPSWIYLTLGLLALLLLGQWLGTGGGIQPGAVVFYVVVLTVGEAHYIPYIINRTLDTGIGVGLSLLINWVFPPPGTDAEEGPAPGDRGMGLL